MDGLIRQRSDRLLTSYRKFSLHWPLCKLTFVITSIITADAGAVALVIGWLLDLQLTVQSVTITTEIVSSNPAHYVIKFISDLRHVGGFLRAL